MIDHVYISVTNVADFDGNRLEFVHKAWNPKRHSQ